MRNEVSISLLKAGGETRFETNSPTNHKKSRKTDIPVLMKVKLVFSRERV